tara:strand:+ start:220 stop:627 length:408 start_codon:yes stop_codon:yes gene_type:complete
MENSNNTGKILAVFTAVVFMFFIYEVMTNTSKVNQLNVPQPSVPNINIINKPTFDPKISVSDNSVTKQENTSVTERNNNNNRNTRRRTRRTRRAPVNINVISASSSTPKSPSSGNSNSSSSIICQKNDGIICAVR